MDTSWTKKSSELSMDVSWTRTLPGQKKIRSRKYGYVTEDGDTKFYLSFDDSKGSLIESGSSSSD